MIIGLNLTSIKAENSEKPVDGPINVNSSPTIENIAKRKLSDGKDALSIKFIFSTSYKPEDGLEVGKAEIKGEVIWKSEQDAELIKEWDANKKLNNETSVHILNAIFRRCLIEVIHLSGVLRLPPPIQFPIVKGPTEKDDKKSKKEAEKYVG